MTALAPIGPGVPGDGIHFEPDSLVVREGVLTGDVDDIKGWTDGNSINLAEVAATPGQDMDIVFLNIRGFRFVGLRMNYVGSTVHWIEIRLWNVILSQWDIFKGFSSGLAQNYRFTDVPIRSSDYIDFDNGNKVIMNIYHPSNGNAAHDSIISYAALIA